MKKSVKTYAGAAAILLAGVTLASCNANSEEVVPTDSEGNVELSYALNQLAPELVASTSAANVSIDLTASEMGIYYDHKEVTDYVDEATADVTVNPFSISAYLLNGSLSIDAGGLDQENPGTNVKAAIEGGFEEAALTLHNTHYVNVDADYTLKSIDAAFYVDSNTLYGDFTDPELADLLTDFNKDSGTLILAENLYGTRTDPLSSNSIGETIRNWLGDFSGIIDALDDIIVAKYDDGYSLTVDMGFDDLVNVWVAYYKWKNPDEAAAKSAEELTALGEEHYSYLDSESFKVYLNIGFDGLKLTNFETDIEISNVSSEVLEETETYTVTSTKGTRLALKSTGTFAYDVADAVQLPSFTNYTK